VICSAPLNTGSENALKLTAQAVLEQDKIPYQSETTSRELVTPDVAAILDVLSSKINAAEDIPSDNGRQAHGLGSQILKFRTKLWGTAV